MENEFFGKPFINSKVTKQALYVVIFLLVLSSCSVTKRIDKAAKQLLQQDSVIGTGHLGISVYDPEAKSYWYNYNAEKYFTPASNTKLFSLYAGMKYLGDSLVGLRYKETESSYYDGKSDAVQKQLLIEPTGDPTFLHPDFKDQRVYNFLKHTDREIYLTTGLEVEAMYGSGWAWDDYNAEYMAARSAFPMYGNIASFSGKLKSHVMITPPYLVKANLVSINNNADEINLYRQKDANSFYFNFNYLIDYSKKIPFLPKVNFVINLLSDTLGKHIAGKMLGPFLIEKFEKRTNIPDKIIHSQPSDSLFKPMMHYSDNFFAEQTLLMVSNEKLGIMNDEKIIDTLLKSDLKDIPQMPQWVDGSGLSRYNLFTPKDFVYLLDKMKNEFGLERMKVILPTGGEGTIKNYYKEDSGFIYVKTGTLSNQVALSGYLITQKNKLLIFSLLANNVNGSATDVRRAFERFLKNLRRKF